MVRPRRSEYLVLRRTIAERGTLRPVLFVAGIGVWAAVLTAVLVLLPYPVAAAIPLLLLVALFEALRPLHFGVERIGRYLQVFYEEAGQPDRPLSDTPSWERVAMRFGHLPGVGGHPLWIPVFFMATVVNYVAVVVPGPVPVELAVMAVPHLSFAAWLVVVDRTVQRQRATEVARLRQLHGGSGSPAPGTER